jgi:hypothetical protein
MSPATPRRLSDAGDHGCFYGDVCAIPLPAPGPRVTTSLYDISFFFHLSIFIYFLRLLRATLPPVSEDRGITAARTFIFYGCSVRLFRPCHEDRGITAARPLRYYFSPE